MKLTVQTTRDNVSAWNLVNQDSIDRSIKALAQFSPKDVHFSTYRKFKVDLFTQINVVTYIPSYIIVGVIVGVGKLCASH